MDERDHKAMNEELNEPSCLGTAISRLSMKQILEYECHSHWLASWISFNWGQELIGWYIARKVARKYKRYLYSLESRNRLKNDL